MLSHELVGAAMQRAMDLRRLHGPALAELQQEKLRGLLLHAVENSPFYADLYRGLDLQQVKLEDLPAVDKPRIQHNFDRVVTDRRLKFAEVENFCETGNPDKRPWFKDAFAVMLSSGTSGNRGYFAMDGPALADAIAMGYRQSNPARAARPPAEKDKPPPQHRIAAVMLIEPFDSAGTLMRLIPESLGPKRLIDNRQTFAEVCGQLNEFQPTLLSSFPYTLRMLSQAKLDGRLTVSPTRILSSGDVLTASDRAAIAEAFGIEPINYYCCTEATYLAWECDVHQGLHVNADYVIVESVDENNRPVPAGRLGAKILITNLSNRVMPLIRYEIADQVEYMDEPCPCGFPLPRIRTVAGRVEHILQLPAASEGKVALIPEQIDDFVGELPLMYQIIQEPTNRLTVNYIPKGPAGPDLPERVTDALAACFARYGVDASIPIDLHAVEKFEPLRAGTNKVCLYWNRSG